VSNLTVADSPQPVDTSTRQDQIDELIAVIEQRVLSQLERRGSRFGEVL
jgi:hypothetical protein